MSDSWTFGSKSAFYTFAREERQLCAVLAHLLMQQGPNVGAFIALFEAQLAKEKLEPYLGARAAQVEQAQVYLEFAFLRDRWNQFNADLHDPGARNKAKLDFLFEMLQRVNTLGRLAKRETYPIAVDKFNECFMGSAGLMVKHDIASPALWTVPALYTLAGLDAGITEERKTYFRDLCKFHWAFRIKPDLVLVIPDLEPICVEGKLESQEGRYPTKPAETKLFNITFSKPERRVRQVELQEFMFRVLLGCGSRPLFIAQKEGVVTIPGPEGKTTNVPQLRWDRVFKELDCSGSTPFVKQYISENRLINPALSTMHSGGSTKHNSSGISAEQNRVQTQSGAPAADPWPNADGRHPKYLGYGYFQAIIDRLSARGIAGRIERIWTGVTGGPYSDVTSRPNWMVKIEDGQHWTSQNACAQPRTLDKQRMHEWAVQDLQDYFGLKF